MLNDDIYEQDGVEISARFRQSIEERIERLEGDANYDESQIPRLDHTDHIRRQMRLVAAQRTEAQRMRRFLERSQPRAPKPFIAL